MEERAKPLQNKHGSQGTESKCVAAEMRDVGAEGRGAVGRALAGPWQLDEGPAQALGAFYKFLDTRLTFSLSRCGRGDRAAEWVAQTRLCLRPVPSGVAEAWSPHRAPVPSPVR